MSCSCSVSLSVCLSVCLSVFPWPPWFSTVHEFLKKRAALYKKKHISLSPWLPVKVPEKNPRVIYHHLSSSKIELKAQKMYSLKNSFSLHHFLNILASLNEHASSSCPGESHRCTQKKTCLENVKIWI